MQLVQLACNKAHVYRWFRLTQITVVLTRYDRLEQKISSAEGARAFASRFPDFQGE